MELSFKDTKKTLEKSIKKFNISLSPFLSNANTTQIIIDDFRKKLKEIDIQYDILINKHCISQEERTQIFQEVQKCKENFSILQKQSVPVEQHCKKTIKGAISFPAKLCKIISTIVSPKKSSKNLNCTSTSKQVVNTDCVIIGNSNEKLKITDLKRTNNNEFYNDNDYSEIFDNNPTHFYIVEHSFVGKNM